MAGRFIPFVAAHIMVFGVWSVGYSQPVPSIMPAFEIPLQNPELMGSNVAVGDGVVVVRSSSGPSTSRVDVHDSNGGTHLFPLDPVISDSDVLVHYGVDIAVRDGVAAVGAPKSSFSESTRNGGVFLFDLSTGEQVDLLVSESISPPGERQWAAPGVRLDIDEDYIAAADLTGAAFVFDRITGEEVGLFGTLTDTAMVTDVSLNNGRLALVKSIDNSISIYDIASPKLERRFIGEAERGNVYVTMSDGGVLVLERNQQSSVLSSYDLSGNLMRNVTVPDGSQVQVDKEYGRMVVWHRDGLELRDLHTLDLIAKPIIPESPGWAAIHGNTIAVTASDSLYVFHLPEPSGQMCLPWIAVLAPLVGRAFGPGQTNRIPCA